MSRWVAGTRRSGVTLAELIIASGLAAIVMVSLVTLMSSVMNLWTRGETARQARESASAVVSIVADDLRQLHGSSEGDLVLDWAPFDVEADGTIERLWPRLRFVRDASAAEVARIERRVLTDAARRERDRLRALAGDRAVDVVERLDEAELLAAAGITRENAALGDGADRDTDAVKLLEVLYAILPEGSKGPERYTGVLYRAERIHPPGSPPQLMRDDAFDSKGRPDLELAREVARGVLWVQPLFATQTTRIASRMIEGAETDDPAATTGWSIGEGLGAAATSWDAWRRGRPDIQVTVWNDPSAGMPRAGERPLLPRRVRMELEILRPSDRDRAPRLLDAVEEGTTSFQVTNGARLSRAVGSHAMIAGEWVRIRSVRGDTVIVVRAQRGTSARLLPGDSHVMFGAKAVLEVPIPMYEDDWRLEPGRVR